MWPTLLRAALLTGFAVIGSSSTASSSSEGLVARVAFGSCSKAELPQPLWESILEREPDLWIWAGDNIYADRLTGVNPPRFEATSIENLRRLYELQKAVPGYAALTQRVPMVATWDDHDYGVNDGDRTFPLKEQSQSAFLDFVDEPLESPRRTQEGVYEARRVVFNGFKILVVALDMRYNRDPYDCQEACDFLGCEEACDFLGEAQWRWLEDTLASSDADAHVFVSSLQLLERRQALGESWARFPAARRRFLEVIGKVKAPIVLSGDVHFGELSVARCSSKQLVELTSSGMTHAWGRGPPQLGKLHPMSLASILAMHLAQRVMPWRYTLKQNGRRQYTLDLNFGELDFFKNGTMQARLLGLGGVVLEETFDLASLGGSAKCEPLSGEVSAARDKWATTILGAAFVSACLLILAPPLLLAIALLLMLLRRSRRQAKSKKP